MTNIALLTAAGIGTRMGSKLPKQFMRIAGKPLIVYTLNTFERHPDIDVIAVACLSGWEDTLIDYAKEYGITKLRHIVPGGSSGQESIRNGLFELEKYYKKDDIILIHDGNRAMVSAEIISDCISVTKSKGNAIAAIPCREAVLISSDGENSDSFFPRESLWRTQTPHGFRLGDIICAHRSAIDLEIKNTASSCVLLVTLGQNVHFSKGSEKNLKITVPEDIDIFNAFLKGFPND